MRIRAATLGLAVMLGLAVTGSAAAETAPRAARPTVALNPATVCVTDRAGNYPSVDIVVANNGPGDKRIDEIRALVKDRKGALLERRMLWQQALDMLGPQRTLLGRSTTTIFNPFAFAGNLAGNTLTFELVFADDPVPVSVSTHPEHCANRHRLILPVAGRLLVYDGYDQLSHHRRGRYDDDWSKAMGIADNFQRFGLDLVAIDAAGRFFRGDGTRTDQWLGWGRPVRAAAAGVVAATHDGQPDNVVIGTVDKWTDRPSRSNPMSSYGNYVLIRHGVGEFTLVGHLRNGSVRVRPGQHVVAGQQIGAIGNSGASGGVHVHFERRTGWGLAGIRTLPAYFSGFSFAGRPRLPRAAVIDSGDVVVGD